MTTSFIALLIAIALVGLLIIGLGFLSLGFGVLDSFLGQPKLTILKSTKFHHGFAFALNWSSAKDEANFDTVRVKLFNPFGSPTQAEVIRNFEPQDQHFATEVDLGESYIKIIGTNGGDQATVEVTLSASNDGVTHIFNMSALVFKKTVKEADTSVEGYRAKKKLDVSIDDAPPINVPSRSFIADTVPGQGAQVVIPTNPAFTALFSNTGGGAGAEAKAEAKPNFQVSKVWIDPGCIVCNACEAIYPDVFEVLPSTCVIRPNAPLMDGLRIQEAAENCPVEVIKFIKIE